MGWDTTGWRTSPAMPSPFPQRRRRSRNTNLIIAAIDCRSIFNILPPSHLIVTTKDIPWRSFKGEISQIPSSVIVWKNILALHSGALEAVSRFFLQTQKKMYQFFSLIVWAYTKSRDSVALILSELLNILYFFNDILYFFNYIFIFFSDKWAEHHKQIK